MKKVKPEKENGWKFELFLQNFMPNVENGKLGVMEVRRETEFAPIKNADGPKGDSVVNDSPASSLDLVLREATEWLQKAGVKISDDAINRVEVNYLLSYEGENLEGLGEITKPGYIN